MAFGVHKNAAAKTPAGRKAPKNGKTETITIDKRVLRAAQRACGPEQKIVLRADGTIDIVNK